MSDQKNFKLINIKAGREAFHLYFNEDKCLFKKNGRKGNIYYYSCIGYDEFSDEKCPVRGKVVDGNFEVLKSAEHNHHNHEHRAEAEELYSIMKVKTTNCSDTIENIYRHATAR